MNSDHLYSPIFNNQKDGTPNVLFNNQTAETFFNGETHIIVGSLPLVINNLLSLSIKEAKTLADLVISIGGQNENRQPIKKENAVLKKMPPNAYYLSGKKAQETLA